MPARSASLHTCTRPDNVVPTRPPGPAEMAAAAQVMYATHGVHMCGPKPHRTAHTALFGGAVDVNDFEDLLRAEFADAAKSLRAAIEHAKSVQENRAKCLKCRLYGVTR